MMKVKSTKYMIFELIKRKPKTDEYEVLNKKTDDLIGIIQWYPHW